MNLEYILVSYLFVYTPLFFSLWVVVCVVEYTSEWGSMWHPDGYDCGWGYILIALVGSYFPVLNLFTCWMLYCNIKSLKREKPWRKTVMLCDYETIGIARNFGGVPVLKEEE